MKAGRFGADVWAVDLATGPSEADRAVTVRLHGWDFDARSSVQTLPWLTELCLASVASIPFRASAARLCARPFDTAASIEAGVFTTVVKVHRASAAIETFLAGAIEALSIAEVVTGAPIEAGEGGVADGDDYVTCGAAVTVWTHAAIPGVRVLAARASI